MSFDIDEIVAQMLAAVKGVVKDNWNLIKDSASEYFHDHKSTLALLASLKINNEISNDFFQKRLADEEKILESELHSIAIVTKAMAKKAANAAIDILEKAITSAIGL